MIEKDQDHWIGQLITNENEHFDDIGHFKVSETFIALHSETSRNLNMK